MRKLTRGEILVIRRRRSGVSQSDAAIRWGVGRKVYSKWELDEVQGPDVDLVEPLQPHERAFILRRRAGVTRLGVARAIGLSEFWVTEMERGRQDPARLTEYWRCKS